MNPDCYIEIPADQLRNAIHLAYEMSRPQGLGILHFVEGSISEDEIDEIIALNRSGFIAVDMDYVNGRACKFIVLREGKKLFVGPYWYDHSDWQLEELLTELGIEDAPQKIEAARESQRIESEQWKRKNGAA